MDSKRPTAERYVRDHTHFCRNSSSLGTAVATGPAVLRSDEGSRVKCRTSRSAEQRLGNPSLARPPHDAWRHSSALPPDSRRRFVLRGTRPRCHLPGAKREEQPLPQTRNFPLFFFLFSCLNPPGLSCRSAARSRFQKRQQEKHAPPRCLPLRSPSRRTPESVPAPPRRQQRREEGAPAGHGGTAGLGRAEGGLYSRSPSVPPRRPSVAEGPPRGAGCWTGALRCAVPPRPPRPRGGRQEECGSAGAIKRAEMLRAPPSAATGLRSVCLFTCSQKV